MKWKILGIAFAMATSGAFASFDNATNGEIISISGQVTNAKANTFTLKTANKDILVEMDDYSNWVADGLKLMNGDNVVVTGMVDKDFLEKKKLEAGSVYVKNLNTTFYANSSDEEDMATVVTVYSLTPTLQEGAQVDLQGKITNVSGREFTVDTGIREVTVDTKDLFFNPLDNKGFTRLSKGDRVKVSGKVDDDFWDSKEVAASTIIELPSTSL